MHADTLAKGQFAIAEFEEISRQWDPYIRLAENSEYEKLRIGAYVGRMTPATIHCRYGCGTATGQRRDRMEAFEKNPPGENHLMVVFVPNPDDTCIQGVCHGILMSEESGLLEIGISVDEAYRNWGVAYAMLKKIETMARSNKKFRGLYVTTHPGNRSMNHLARARNFIHQPNASSPQENIWILEF